MLACPQHKSAESTTTNVTADMQTPAASGGCHPLCITHHAFYYPAAQTWPARSELAVLSPFSSCRQFGPMTSRLSHDGHSGLLEYGYESHKAARHHVESFFINRHGSLGS